MISHCLEFLFDVVMQIVLSLCCEPSALTLIELVEIFLFLPFHLAKYINNNFAILNI